MHKSVPIVLAALAMVACEDRTSTPPRSTVTPAPSTTPNTTPRTTPSTPSSPSTTSPTPGLPGSADAANRTLSTEVKRVLSSVQGMSDAAQNITVTANNGVVTLRGTVDTRAQKDALEEKARAVPGVTQVDNQIEVSGS